MYRVSVLTVTLLFATVLVPGQTVTRFTGLVVDTDGNSIAGAEVTVRYSNETLTTQTDNLGAFALDISPLEKLSLEVSASGFGSRTVQIAPTTTAITITLSPAVITEKVTVTRTEARLEDAPASIVALTANELETTSALTLDDRLRQVPGFSLFRRAGSRTANPTTQGVSLRGVGASGASRALILANGIPLNDPFGGWVYWGRVPSESVQQIEVLRGPAGDLYGSSAIGGVVSILTRRPTLRPTFSLESSYGNQRTPSGSLFASAGSGRWAASIAGEFLRTDGFVPVAPEQRGMIDTKAGVRRWVLTPTMDHTFADKGRIFASAEFFYEQRTNGTPLQTNDTDLRSFSAGFDWRGLSVFSLRTYAGTQDYNQSFSGVAADRNNESLTRVQHVPSRFVGVDGQWNRNFGRAMVFAGFDARFVRGRSDETGFVAGDPTSDSSSGGREITSGILAGATMSGTDRLQINTAIRYDVWRNHRGVTTTRSRVTGASSTTHFPDRTESALSPRISALYRVSVNVSLSGSIAEGFRRPTLNELYRNFRVGDVLTLANSELRAERAIGADGAILVTALDRRIFIRTGVFCTRVRRNVSNITIGETPALITRQRQNVGETRACGIESDGEFRLTDEIKLSSGYLFADARVTAFPANASLEGLLIPQIPRHQLTMQAAYSNAKIATLAVQIRATSSQFDDDQNQFRLAGFTTFDAFVAKQFLKNVLVFAAFENLFDKRIESGRTPVLTLAGRTMVRIGFRLRVGRGS